MKFRFRHNKSYIDQASSVRMVEVWPRSNAKKKKLARIQLSRLVNNVFIIYSKYMSVSTVFISGEDGRVGGGGGTNCRRE